MPNPLTPVEVKFRSEKMGSDDVKEALLQAASLSQFLIRLKQEETGPEALLWRLAFQHLLASMISFGFRVYSQQRLAANASEAWATIHSRVISALLSNSASLSIDDQGRLIVIDGTPTSKPADSDVDGFKESIFLSTADATNILREPVPAIVGSIKKMIGTWRMLPEEASVEASSPSGQGEDPVIPVSSSEEPSLPAIESEPPTLPPAEVIPEESGPGIQFPVGTTVDAFTVEERFFNPSDTRLSQLNIGVVGDLGKGKTQFLKAMILNLAHSKEQNRGIRPRMLIFDYKRDYSSADFVAAANVRVVKPQGIPLNIFDISEVSDSLTPWLDRFNFFADLLSKIYTGIGPVQRRNLKTAVKAAYENCTEGKFPTVYDVYAHYVEILDGKADAPLAILEEMVDREMFVRDSSKAIPFSSFLDGIVVIDLASLGQDDKTKNVLVAAMLNTFYEHMLRIPKRPFIGTDPQLRVVDSFLLVDEADNIMKYEFDVLRKLLLQGREFGVGVILASQYLSHFRAGQTDYREPLLTWFIHGVPNVVPAELSSLGITSQTAELSARIVSLPNHQCLYKSFTGTAEIIRGVPFFELWPQK
jgi:DNA phosphorothioation-dependent restriction protein DptH